MTKMLRVQARHISQAEKKEGTADWFKELNIDNEDVPRCPSNLTASKRKHSGSDSAKHDKKDKKDKSNKDKATKDKSEKDQPKKHKSKKDKSKKDKATKDNSKKDKKEKGQKGNSSR